MTEYKLEFWTIYDHPTDYPENFVVRRSVVEGPSGLKPDKEVKLASTLEEARELIPPGYHRFDRDPTDPPVIVECWMS
jgi:hypothetical protein